MAEKEKPTFIMYKSWAKYLLALPDDKASVLIKAICAYQLGESYEIDDVSLKVYLESVIIPDMQMNAQKYQEQCDKNAKNAQKGGQAKASKSKRSEATASDRQRPEASGSNGSETCRNLHESESDSDSDSEPASNNKKTCASPSQSALTHEFETIWLAYPRKQGKKDAFAAYCRDRKQGRASPEQVLNGVEAYCDYIRRNNVSEKYIKQGDTFFRQQAWQDDWSGGKSADPYLNNHPPHDLDGILT